MFLVFVLRLRLGINTIALGIVDADPVTNCVLVILAPYFVVKGAEVFVSVPLPSIDAAIIGTSPGINELVGSSSLGCFSSKAGRTTCRCDRHLGIRPKVESLGKELGIKLGRCSVSGNARHVSVFRCLPRQLISGF